MQTIALEMTEYVLSEDYFNGYILVADFMDVNVTDLLAAMNPVEFGEGLKLYTQSLGLRIKGFHFVTTSKMIQAFVTLLRQFISQKLGDRIHIHKDIHSQDEIVGAFAKIEKEICVKFFNTPVNYNATAQDKILYISNPDKRKSCPPDHYDYSKNVVDMTIGYKCINQRDIARIIVDMLRASIEETVSIINSYDLVKKFQQREQEMKRTKDSLLSPNDRNYINAHYHSECGALSDRNSVISRRTGTTDTGNMQLSETNERYYANKRWPLGLVMYGVEKKLRGTPDHALLKYAMTSIELNTCIVFQDLQSGDSVLAAKNYLWFGSDGEDAPQFGFRAGKQALKLESITHGAPGHTAHAITNLMRALGVPMMSNRFDRNNYVIINWNHVEKGKEHYLEKDPKEAWVESIPYDFNSITHAPANFMCADCVLGAQTVQPVQDHLWQRTMSMGHKTDLSQYDVQFMGLLYNKECQQRSTT